MKKYMVIALIVFLLILSIVLAEAGEQLPSRTPTPITSPLQVPDVVIFLPYVVK